MSTLGSQKFGLAVVGGLVVVVGARVVGLGVVIVVGTGVGIGVGTGVGSGPMLVGPGFVCSVVVGNGPMFVGSGFVVPPGGWSGGVAAGDCPAGGTGPGEGPALAGPGVVAVSGALGAVAFSSHVCWRRSGVTHTASPTKASRQTYPDLQVRGPYAPPLGSRRLAALAFSPAI
jgi:hypothetical protein